MSLGTMYRHAKKKDEVTELTTSEFRALVLNSLNKVNNKDTVKNGVEELVAIIPDLSTEDESLTIYMNCLLETSNVEKEISQYKKETIKLIASAASVHQDALQSYLTKIMNLAIKYLKDKDSTIRDVVAESLLVIVKNINPPLDTKTGSDEPNLSVYFLPLFQLLSEHNKAYQIGASLCIQSVLKGAKETDVNPYLTRIITRIQKQLSLPTCLARSSILSCVGTLVEVSRVECIPFVPTIISFFVEGLASSEWDARKAAAEGFQKLAMSLKDAISPYKQEVLTVLEGAKFDKIKPCREAVAEAIELFQSISPDSAASTPRSGTQDTFNATLGDGTGTLRKKNFAKSKTLSSFTAPKIPSNTSNFGTIRVKPTSNTTTSKTGTQRVIPHTIYVPPPPRTAPDSGLQFDDEQDINPENRRDRAFSTADMGSFQIESRLNEAESTHPAYKEPESNQIKASPYATMRRTATESSFSGRRRAVTHDESMFKRPDQVQLQAMAQHATPTKVASEPSSSPRQKPRSENGTPRIRSPSPVEAVSESPRSSNSHMQDSSFEKLSSQIAILTEQYTKLFTMFEDFTLTTKNEISTLSSRVGQIEQAIIKLQNTTVSQPANNNAVNVDKPASIIKSNPNSAPTTPRTVAPQTQSEISPLPPTTIQQTGTAQTPRSSEQRTMATNQKPDTTSSTVPTTSSNVDNSVWDAAIKHVNIGHIEGAYAKILKDGDTLQLIRLMETTGPVLDKLYTSTASQLFVRFIVFLRTHSFVDNIFPWLRQGIERTVIPLSQQQLNQLLKALQDMSVSPDQQGIEASELYTEIKRHISPQS